MKKIFISLFLSGVFMYHTNAQTAVEGNKFLDNWSIGISAGGTTPLTHHSFFGNMRPITGIGLNKQLTPVFGFGLEAVHFRPLQCQPVGVGEPEQSPWDLYRGSQTF